MLLGRIETESEVEGKVGIIIEDNLSHFDSSVQVDGELFEVFNSEITRINP